MKLTAIVTNRKTAFQGTETALAALRQCFRFHKPGYYWSPRYRSGDWDGYTCLFRYGKVPTGLFLDMQSKLKQKFQFRLMDQRVMPEFCPLPETLIEKLRDYQAKCVEAMAQNSNCGGLIVNCTASGKTRIAGAYFARLTGTGCFINDELTLLEQSRQALSELLGSNEVGIVGNGEFQPRRVTVATIQTLHRHRNNPKFALWFRSLQAVIIDEVHIALNKQNVDVLDRIKPPAIFGLTATLELEKPHIRMPATALAGPPIFCYPLAQGVQEKVISHGVFLQILFPQKPYSHNYALDHHGLISHSKTRNNCVEALVREGLHRNRRIIVLVERLAHLKILSKRLQDVPHRVICGAYSKEERFAAKTAMDAGTTSLILASRVFAKGVDIRTVDTIIDATGGRSKNAVTQRYGRGTRIASEKCGLLYLDIGDWSVPGTKNRFQVCSRSRRQAIKKLEVAIHVMSWKENAAAMYQAGLKRLKAEVPV